MHLLHTLTHDFLILGFTGPLRSGCTTAAKFFAENLDGAVYDLKAVNPNDNSKADTRTTAEIIESIEEQGKIVTAALAKLKNMLEDTSALQ